MLSYIGFSKDAGAVGETEHPFTLNFSSKDVRVTNHYYEHDPISAMFSAIHEGGHAIFEQNVNPNMTTRPQEVAVIWVCMRANPVFMRIF